MRALFEGTDPFLPPVSPDIAEAAKALEQAQKIVDAHNDRLGGAVFYRTHYLGNLYPDWYLGNVH